MIADDLEKAYDEARASGPREAVSGAKYVGSHGREGKMIQVNGLNHIVLHVQDVARAKKFYTELLGMTVYRENDAQAFLHCGHQGVALFKKQGDTPLTTGNDLNHLALDVESGTYEVLKAELEQHGVKVSGRPGDPHCIYFHDPDGHRLQLMVHE